MSEADQINALSQVIRRIDGNHTMGAGALAEAILERRIEWDTPRIIRTVEELEAEDPDSLLIDSDREESFASRMQMSIRTLGEESMYYYALPAVVIREGAEARAAQEALEKDGRL